MPEIVCQPLPGGSQSDVGEDEGGNVCCWQGCLGVQTFLRGCDKLVPCAMPSVDNCRRYLKPSAAFCGAFCKVSRSASCRVKRHRFDVSRCTQVPPGGSCEVQG